MLAVSVPEEYAFFITGKVSPYNLNFYLLTTLIIYVHKSMPTCKSEVRQYELLGTSSSDFQM